MAAPPILYHSCELRELVPIVWQLTSYCEMYEFEALVVFSGVMSWVQVLEENLFIFYLILPLPTPAATTATTTTTAATAVGHYVAKHVMTTWFSMTCPNKKNVRPAVAEMSDPTVPETYVGRGINGVAGAKLIDLVVRVIECDDCDT